MAVFGKVAGIVCEYNPFHNGHKRQIDILREAGFSTIVCAMSGNYTQRGELAIADKYTRAEIAVRCGADIVLELPFPFSSFSAEGFARAGVHLLASAGCDTVSFGSECADLALLERAADTVLSEDFARAYADSQRSVGSARSYFDLLSDRIGENVKLLSNDILAISYLSAVRRGNYRMNVFPILRQGAAYREEKLEISAFPSATAVRKAVKKSPEGFLSFPDGYLPSEAVKTLQRAQAGGLAPVFTDRIGVEILSFFRLMTPEDIIERAVRNSNGGAAVCEDGCGIVERLCCCAKKAHSFEDFITSAYNSRYTDARIRRVMLFSLIGISDAFAKAIPTYAVLLGASENGRRYLSSIRKSADFPIVTKPADAPEGAFTELLRLSDSLYTSAMPKDVSFDHFLKNHPFIA